MTGGAGTGGGARAETWYAATANPFPALPELRGEAEADVCVVGGGLTGVSTALHLAERGYRTVLLEAGRLGHGASGRNGGQLVTGYSCDMARIRRDAGLEASRAMWDMGAEALADVRRRTARHRISCDLRAGYLFAARTARQAADLERTAREWEEIYGYRGPRLVERAGMGGLVGTEAYAGGLHDPGGGQIHPLNYLLGLAGAARAAGAELFERSAVEGWERCGRTGRPVVRAARGRARARFLVFAGNAYLGRLVPELARRLAPVASFVGVTPPLDAGTAARLFPADVAVADCDVAIDYYRLTADKRLLFGAGAAYAGRGPADPAPRLARRAARVFPYLAPARMERAWTGLIGVTTSRAPDFGRLAPDIYYAQGFSGHGVALTGMAGKTIAEAIAGQAERFDIFAALRHRPFPGGRLRAPALALAMAWYRLRDRLG